MRPLFPNKLTKKRGRSTDAYVSKTRAMMQELERQEMKVSAAALLRPRHMHAHINSDVTPVHVCRTWASSFLDPCPDCCHCNWTPPCACTCGRTLRMPFPARPRCNVRVNMLQWYDSANMPVAGRRRAGGGSCCCMRDRSSMRATDGTGSDTSHHTCTVG